MDIDTLIRFLQTLDEPLRSCGGTKAANELREVCTGLRPFGGMAFGQFAEFLMRADHYTKTGELPIVATTRKKSTAAKQVDAAKIQEAAQIVQDLFERAIDDSLDYSEIEAELKRLDKSLSKEEAIELARESNIVKTVRSKKAAFEEIKNRIFDRKQSYQRTNF